MAEQAEQEMMGARGDAARLASGNSPSLSADRPAGAAHSPGPWTRGRSDWGVDYEGSSQWFTLLADNRDAPVAIVPGDHWDNAETEANASLIEAAPELLASTRTLLALVRLRYGNLDSAANAVMEAAERAIAKASAQ